jgi:P pilus assembly chaperone PapD
MYTTRLLHQSRGFLKSCHSRFIIAALILLSVFSSFDGQSQGNLLLFPRRVVFEGSRKSQEISLTNTGQDTSKYVVSIVQMRMKPDGSFEQINAPDSGQYFADKYLRFFPRTVTLGPNESQVVKVQLNKTEGLKPGEYRSHIYFRAIPSTKPLGEEEKKAIDTTTVSVSLTPIFGITIPVIIRVGEATGKVNLSDISFVMVNDTTPKLTFNFNRSGNTSIFGNLEVTYVSPQGKVTKVGTVKGIAIYTPNVLRKFQYVLERPQGVDYHKGKLHILYSAPTDAKSAKLAEADVALH